MAINSRHPAPWRAPGYAVISPLISPLPTGIPPWTFPPPPFPPPPPPPAPPPPRPRPGRAPRAAAPQEASQAVGQEAGFPGAFKTALQSVSAAQSRSADLQKQVQLEDPTVSL